jgi:hypothetical protein
LTGFSPVTTGCANAAPAATTQMSAATTTRTTRFAAEAAC